MSQRTTVYLSTATSLAPTYSSEGRVAGCLGRGTVGSGRRWKRGRELGSPGERGWELEAPGEWDRALEAPRELDWGLETPRGAGLEAGGAQVLLYFGLCPGESMFCLSWPVLLGIPRGKPRRVGVRGGRRKACVL